MSYHFLGLRADPMPTDEPQPDVLAPSPRPPAEIHRDMTAAVDLALERLRRLGSELRAAGNPVPPFGETRPEIGEPRDSISVLLDDVAGQIMQLHLHLPRMTTIQQAMQLLTQCQRSLEYSLLSAYRPRDKAALRRAAVQVAAMAIRLADDVCDGAMPLPR